MIGHEAMHTTYVAFRNRRQAKWQDNRLTLIQRVWLLMDSPKRLRVGVFPLFARAFTFFYIFPCGDILCQKGTKRSTGANFCVIVLRKKKQIYNVRFK